MSQLRTPARTSERTSPFAADLQPDGSRRYSHDAVVARRTLLAGLVGVGVSGGVLLTQLGPGDAVRGIDPALDQLPVANEPVAGATTSPAPGFSTTGFSTTEAASQWVVVNKQHPLDPVEYAPAVATVGGREVAALIAPDLQALLDAAAADGVSLSVTSGYRSYARQQTVHDNAVARDGLESAESVSARPGFSEHQTGLAVDFGGSSTPGCLLENCFGQTPESAWLRERAGGFGFLLRYPDGLTDVTGYDPEPWHWRWVGTDLVQRMSDAGVLTLEQFFDITGGVEYV